MSLSGSANAEVLRGKINGLEVLCIDAYAVAVRNGFEGTEEEWLASLKGEKGDPGDSGDISDKVDKVPEATGGHLAVFVGPEGGIADCGIPCSKVVTTDNIGNYAPSPGYAKIGEAGVVKLATLCGLKMGTGTEEGILYVDQAPESIFPYRPSTGSTMPITVGNIDFAVKTCLTDGKQVVTWSDEEKQAARTLLGAATIEIQEAVSTLDSNVGEITDALNECYELLETINVAEEGVKTITRTLPNVKRLKMRVMAPAGTAQSLVIVRTYCNGAQIGGASITGGINIGVRHSGAEFYHSYGYWDGYISGAISDAGSPPQRLGMSYNYTLTKSVKTYPHIDEVTITSNTSNVYFPVGTTIELWGVKQNEN